MKPLALNAIVGNFAAHCEHTANDRAAVPLERPNPINDNNRSLIQINDDESNSPIAVIFCKAPSLSSSSTCRSDRYLGRLGLVLPGTPGAIR